MNNQIKITKIDNIEDFSYLEEFDFKFRNETHTIKYFHSSNNLSLDEIKEKTYNSFFVDFVNKMQLFIPEDSDVLDIGAFDGDTSIPLALMAGEKGKCISVECGPAWNRLQINANLNSNLNISTYNYAMMDQNSISSFNYNNDVGGPSYKTDTIGKYPLKRLVVGINSVEFLDSLNIKNLSLIKSDTEGADMRILNLIDKYINLFRPVIHVEWFPTTENEISKFLKEKDYSSIDFKTDWNKQIEIFETLPNYWTQDLILLPKEKTKIFN
jgi:FkbM family methyltransferase